MRMLVSRFCVLMGMLAMFVSRRSVCLCFIMLTHVVMMCRLQVVMGGSVMMSGGSVMVLAGSVLLFRHA
jgi:ABC-type enterobactin transport system permease subunit